MEKESVAIIDANTGVLEKELHKIIGSMDEFQMLLTGNAEILVFNNIHNNKPEIQLYSANGSLTKSIDASFYKGVIAYDIVDAKIDKHGNLIMHLGDEILSVKLNIATISSNSWNYRQGTNGNTNALN